MHQEYRVTARSGDGGELTREGGNLGRVIAELKSVGYRELLRIEAREVSLWREVPVLALRDPPAMGAASGR